MKIKGRILLVACGLILVMGTTLSAAPQASEIVRSVISGGGGQLEQSPYTLDGTIGQAVVGQAANSPYELCSGFWCGTEGYKVYLPLVLRNY
jgi:hypothetical protein